jgi:4-hydroxythreonine-4-phosphate dehydrogenase
MPHTPDIQPDTRPIVALVLGDATGIGPEISARALANKAFESARIVVVGDARVLEQGMADAGVTFAWERVTHTREVDWTTDVVPLIDLGNIDPTSFPRGAVSALSGKLTGDTLAAAIEMSRDGQFDAISFAPLNKQALSAGGWKFPDEHKMFAHLLRHNGHFSEMNVLDGQWMARVTSHVSLREALDQINPQSIENAIRLADTTMRRAGIAKPRLAVCALNPHAGEGGMFGMEEIEVIRPTVDAVAATGIDVKGPYPSDTVFLKAFAGEFDSVVSMYHDQGQIATKLKGFNRGVTVTAGLQTVFTTPAHGTAFDIVGQGKASTGALESAVRLAAQLAAARKREQVASTA